MGAGQKIESLSADAKKVEKEIATIDREIERLETQKIDRRQLKGILKEFSSLFRNASAETKRRLFNILIEEVQCHVKKGDAKGTLEYKLRGDGSMVKEWQTGKNKENPTPDGKGSSFQGAWLRRQDSNPPEADNPPAVLLWRQDDF